MKIATNDMWRLVNGGTVPGWKLLEWKVTRPAGESMYRVVLERDGGIWGHYWIPGPGEAVTLSPMEAFTVTEYRFKEA